MAAHLMSGAWGQHSRPEEPDPDSISELYHENSKLHPCDQLAFAIMAMVNSTSEIRRFISQPSQGYRGFPTVALPRALPPGTMSFDEAVWERRSVRRYAPVSLPLSAVARILRLGDGVVRSIRSSDGVEWPVRAAPSAGGLYPIEQFCIMQRVDGLTPGLYLYQPHAHAVVLLQGGHFQERLQRATGLTETVEESAICVVLTADLRRIRFKYGERSYRFCLLEAGHIAQNLLLAAQTAGLGAVPVGGFIDDEINDLLQLDGSEQFALYLVFIGAPDPSA